MKIMFSLIFSHLFPPHLLLSTFLLSCWRTNLPWMNLFWFGLCRITCLTIYKNTPFLMHLIYFAHVGNVTEGHFSSAVKFVIELITRRKSNSSHWVSRAICWRCFCYSLCKDGTQTNEKNRFCNRKIFPKKDPQSRTRLTPFSCFPSFWTKSGCSNCVVVSTSMLPVDQCDVH